MAGSRPQKARAILLAAAANRGESVSEVGVAQISAFQLGLQEPFDLGLPILPLLEATREALTGFVPGRRSLSKARFWLAILFHRLAVLLKSSRTTKAEKSASTMEMLASGIAAALFCLSEVPKLGPIARLAAGLRASIFI
jgi:hypothetical protein